MSTLTELNSYSNNTVTFTDNRQSEVVFDYPTARDISTITQLTNVFNVERNIDIIDIIGDATALNIEFKVDVSAVAGATVTWPTIPAGSSVVINNSIFTINGITTVNTWNNVSVPFITLPITFNGSFFYDCTIKYTTAQGIQTKTWTVGSYVPVSEATSIATLVATPNRLRGTISELNTNFALATELKDIALVATFNLDVLTINFNRASAALTTSASIELFAPFVIDVNRTYLSNSANTIFASDTPYIQDNSPSPTETFDLTLTPTSNTKIGTDISQEGVSALTLTGLLSQVNSQISNVILYPGYNNTSNIEVAWILEKDNVVIDTGNIYFTHAGSGTLATNYYTFNNSGTLNFKYDEFLYGNLDVLMVGGGGGSTYEGGGGGAGGVREILNFAIPLKSNTISVGNGGSRNTTTSNCVATHGGDGNNTIAFGITVLAGQGGRGYECYTSPPASTTWIKDGGANRSSPSFAGEVKSGTVPYQYSAQVGGGGGGAGEAGGTNGVGYGGDGIISTIFGGYFGGGGAGQSAPTVANQGTGGGAGGGGHKDYNTNGTPNTGGGGGAGFGTSTFKPGNGGSGIVKVKVKAK